MPDRIQIKNPAQLDKMRVAGLVVADVLDAVTLRAGPGVTPAELDDLAAKTISAAGAVPNFLGYGHPPYPAVTCISVNEVVVHGIPGDRPLQDGDLVSIDCGAIVDGWHGDAAVTLAIGTVSPEAQELSEACERALWAGIAAMLDGGRLRDVGAAVEDSVRSADSHPLAPTSGYGLLDGYGGHGIGTEMHMAPFVANHRVRQRGPRLQPGLVLAIEPMLTRGTTRSVVLDDEWTVATEDGSLSAHWEHTVAVTPAGPWVLTARDGGAHRLAEFGIATAAGTG